MWELVDRLHAAGFQHDQSEAIIRVVFDSTADFVTRDRLDTALAQVIIPLKTQLKILWWVIGCTGISIVVALLIFIL